VKNGSEIADYDFSKMPAGIHILFIFLFNETIYPQIDISAIAKTAGSTNT